MKYINDNNLESILCLWKETMRMSLEGLGTSFHTDVNKLSDNQIKCYYCSGLETQCSRYQNKNLLHLVE